MYYNASHHRHISRHFKFRFVQCIENAKGDHIVQARQIAVTSGDSFQELTCQLVTNLMLPESICATSRSISSLAALMMTWSFRPFSANPFRNPSTRFDRCLPPSRRWRRRVCPPLRCPQFKEMFCHHASQFGIVQFHSAAYIEPFILVIDDCNRNRSSTMSSTSSIKQ